MTNIRKEAYTIIVKVLAKNVFSDKLLERMSKRLQDAGENANLLYMLVKGVIKMRANLDYVISQYTDASKWENTALKIKILLYLGFYQLLYTDSVPDHAAVDETVELAKKLFGNKIGDFFNAVMRSYLRNPQITYPADPAKRLAAEYSFPVEMVTTWISYWGRDDTELLCMYFNDVPALHVRINTMATNKKRLSDYLSRRNIKVTPSPASQAVFTSDQVHDILSDVAFLEGYYSVQDTSAVMVVELLDPHMQNSILDLFAAPGGKATYMAEIMANTGEIIAVDKFPNKIKRLKQAIERLQIKNINAIAEDAFHYGPVAPAFDKVLLDVPCSGWGVFQKKSELRWQAGQNMDELLKLQENALKLGASFVKKGGYLVYSTCTLNRQENQQQIEKFLKRNPGFVLVPADQHIPAEYTENGYLQTIPFKHAMDGAFAAKLQKI